MTLQIHSVFDPAQEALDGRGWTLTYWDDTNPVQVASPTQELFHRLTNPKALVAQVSNKALTTNVVTLTTSAAHGFVVNQIVQVAIGDLVFDGVYTITAVGSSTTFSYARTHADVVSASATGEASVAIFPYIQSNVITKALATNVVTLTTGGPHGLSAGQYVTVDINDTVFDGTYLITAVTSNTVSYAKTHADVSSASTTGTVRTERSMTERIKEICAADPTIYAYFTSIAQTTVLTANQATVTADVEVLLTAEGLI